MPNFYTRVKQDKPLRFSPLSNEILEVNVHNISAVHIGEGEEKRTVRRYTTEPCRGGFLCPLCPMHDPLFNMLPSKLQTDQYGNEQHFPTARKFAVFGWDHNEGEPRILVTTKTAVAGMKSLQEEREDITNYTFKIKFEKPAYVSTSLARAEGDINLDNVNVEQLVDTMRQRFDVDYRIPRSSEDLAMAIDPTTTKKDRDGMTPPPPRTSQPPVKKVAAPDADDDSESTVTALPGVQGDTELDFDVDKVKSEIILLATQNGDKFSEINEALQNIGLSGLNDIPDSAAKEALEVIQSVVN